MSSAWWGGPVFLAHAFGQRYELPLPLMYFVFDGAAVVLLSFLVVLPREAAASDELAVEGQS